MVELIKEFGADAITMAVAGLCVLIRYLQALIAKQSISTEACTSALLNGASIFPFALMVGAAFSPTLLEIAAASKISISIAGGVGLFSVLGEVCRPGGLKRVFVDSSAPAANDEFAAISAVVDDLHKALSAAEKASVREGKAAKRLPKELDGKLLSTCRQRLARDLKYHEKAAARSRLFDAC